MDTHSDTSHRRAIAAGIDARSLALFVLAALVLAAGSVACGDPLTMAQETQTAGADMATPVAIASTPPATEAAAPPTPAAWATLFPPPTSSDPMYVSGSIWVDARPAPGEVLAFINGQRCGRGESGFPVDAGRAVSRFFIAIASDAVQPGCGVAGSLVTITINDRALNDTIEWRPGIHLSGQLSAGPVGALYYGRLLFAAPVDGRTRPERRVAAYTEGVACGAQLSGMFVQGTGVVPGPEEWTYAVVVDPVELRPGCGQADAVVSFRLEIDGQPAVDLGSTPWQTGEFVVRPTIDFTTIEPATP